MLGRFSVGNCKILLLAALPFFLQPILASAQEPIPLTPDRPGSNPAEMRVEQSPVNVYVTVREINGLALDHSANVTLNCPLVGLALNGSTKDTSQVQFMHVPSGDCKVEVATNGFKRASERITVNETIVARIQYVFVYLHPESEMQGTSARPVVTPGLLQEMDKSAEAIRKSKVDDARKHLDKALRISPNNPDVLYLDGLLAMNQNNYEAAKQKFQRAVSVYPSHERSLLALGEVQLKLKENEPAAETMEALLRQDSSSWRAHLIAAAAYAQVQNYTKAEQHAERAMSLSGANSGAAQLLLGQILAAEGNREGARKELQDLAANKPNDPSAAAAREALAVLDKANAPPEPSRVGPSILPAFSSASMRVWAPPDVDAAPPSVSTDVACPDTDVIEQAGFAAKRQFQNLERFVATEHIEHEEIGASGEAEHLRTRDFNYMVFVDQDKKDKQLYLDEKRDGGTGIDSFPTSLATVGLIGLGIDIFQPGFARALSFKCEGLGQWRGKAAWVMHFTQKSGERSFLRLWQTKIRTVEVPLKGRLWISTNSFDVLHVETDLRDPMKELELARDHISIDYGPVEFTKSKTELWLPWTAEIFLDLHGHHYHHRHTLSNYALFDVATDNKISAPKNIPVEEDDKPVTDPNKKPQ
jgi:tetratricopeptide (TPR) repeat protein